MDTNFLTTEYELCFEQLRYYDTRQEELLKFLFTLTSATAAAQFAVLQFFGNPGTYFFAAQGLLFLVVFIASALIFLMMLQNRLYFVYIARQINAIRKYMLEMKVPTFKDNQLYTSTSFSAFKLSSIHTLQLIGAAFISAIFAAVSTFGILHALSVPFAAKSAVLVCIVVGLTEIIGGASYLKNASAKTSDESVHRR